MLLINEIGFTYNYFPSKVNYKNLSLLDGRIENGQPGSTSQKVTIELGDVHTQWWCWAQEELPFAPYDTIMNENFKEMLRMVEIICKLNCFDRRRISSSTEL